MERLYWMAAGAALVLVNGCQKPPSFDQGNAIFAIARADAAFERIEKLERRVGDLERHAREDEVKN